MKTAELLMFGGVKGYGVLVVVRPCAWPLEGAVSMTTSQWTAHLQLLAVCVATGTRACQLWLNPQLEAAYVD